MRLPQPQLHAALGAPFVALVIGPADFVNAGAMRRGINKRVETASPPPVPAEVGAKHLTTTR
jgi:hypothetical protein